MGSIYNPLYDLGLTKVVTTFSTPNGLGINYKNATLDEANLGAWGTVGNHIPSEDRIIANNKRRRFVQFFARTSSLAVGTTLTSTLQNASQNAGFFLDKAYKLVGISLGLSMITTSDAISQIGVTVNSYTADGTSSLFPAYNNGTVEATTVTTLPDTSSVSVIGYTATNAVKDITLTVGTSLSVFCDVFSADNAQYPTVWLELEEI